MSSILPYELLVSVTMSVTNWSVNVRLKGCATRFCKRPAQPQNDIDNLGKPREHEDVDNPGPVLATINCLPLTINPLIL